jgi:hypothetical protein
VKKLSGTPWDSVWLFNLMDQPFKDQPRRDLLDQTDQETLFHDLYLALDESPVEEESLYRPVRFPVSCRTGSLHRTKLRAAFYLLLGTIKIDHQGVQVKEPSLLSIHISSTSIINKLFITLSLKAAYNSLSGFL